MGEAMENFKTLYFIILCEWNLRSIVQAVWYFDNFYEFDPLLRIFALTKFSKPYSLTPCCELKLTVNWNNYADILLWITF